jgi:hypothetical protein
MDTLTNPLLNYMTVVKLDDGTEGTIVDKAVEKRTRLIDRNTGKPQIGGPDRIHVKHIVECVSFGIRYKCRWD